MQTSALRTVAIVAVGLASVLTGCGQASQLSQPIAPPVSSSSAASVTTSDAGPSASTVPSLTQQIKKVSGSYGWAVVSAHVDANTLHVATSFTANQTAQAMTLCQGLVAGYSPLPTSIVFTDDSRQPLVAYNDPKSPKTCAILATPNR